MIGNSQQMTKHSERLPASHSVHFLSAVQLSERGFATLDRAKLFRFYKCCSQHFYDVILYVHPEFIESLHQRKSTF